MNEKRVLHIEISSVDASLEQFADAWEQAECGETVAPYHGVGFENMSQLLATLTPKRWELIERLRKEGPQTTMVWPNCWAGITRTCTRM